MHSPYSFAFGNPARLDLPLEQGVQGSVHGGLMEGRTGGFITGDKGRGGVLRAVLSHVIKCVVAWRGNVFDRCPVQRKTTLRSPTIV